MYLLVVRQLEQQVKLVLDNIGSDGDKKRELIRGEAVDKAEQLSKPPMYLSLHPLSHLVSSSLAPTFLTVTINLLLCMLPLFSLPSLSISSSSLEHVRLIQESLDAFREALSKQQKQQ